MTRIAATLCPLMGGDLTASAVEQSGSLTRPLKSGAICVIVQGLQTMPMLSLITKSQRAKHNDMNSYLFHCFYH